MFSLVLASVFFFTVRLFIGIGVISLDDANRIAGRAVVPALVLAMCYLVVRRYLFVQRFNKLPGMKSTIGMNGFLSSVLANKRRGTILAVAAQEYVAALSMLRFEGDDGGMYGGFMGPLAIVIVTSPDTIRQVLLHPQSQRKGPSYSTIKYAVGDGLVTAWGHKWAFHRKLLTPAFHFQILESLMCIVIPHAKRLTERLENEAASKCDRSIDNITSHIFDTTLDVLCQSSMGIESTSELNGNQIKKFMSRWFAMFSTITVTPWMWIPGLFGISSFGREYNRYCRATRKFTDKVISKRMSLLKNRVAGHSASEGEKEFSRKIREPFMDIMIHEHLREPDILSLADIRDETNVFSIAGRDTTGWSVIYTLLLLGHHPHVQDKLFCELEEHFSRERFEQLTPEKIKQFTYLDAVYNESLRLYTPIPLITRVADEDIHINGRVIPKGAEILLTISNVHRDPRYWPDPHRFKPERFLKPLDNPYVFIPFVAGPRNCIGQRYAKIQAKCLIISIVRQYRIQSITQLDQVPTFFAPVLHTLTPIKVALHQREINNNL